MGEEVKKKITRMIIASFVLALLAAVPFSKTLGCREIQEIELKVADTINPDSAGRQIRIQKIENQSGEQVDLRQMAERVNWTYDDELGAMAYYSDNKQNIKIPLSDTRNVEITLLKQPSSGKLEISLDGRYNKTVDLYSTDWENETVTLNEGVEWKKVGFFTVFVFGFFLFLIRFLAYLVEQQRDWRRNCKKIISAYILIAIVGMCLAAIGAVHIYPEQTLQFENDYSNAELLDFEINGDKLQSVSGDPNMTIYFKNGNVWVENIQINIDKFDGWKEWGQAFLLNEDYTEQEYFLSYGKNQVEFPIDLTTRAKAAGVRLDLVSRTNVEVGVSSVVINDTTIVALWAVRTMVILYAVILFLIFSVWIIKKGVAGTAVQAMKIYLFCLNAGILIGVVEAVQPSKIMENWKMIGLTYIGILLLQLLVYEIIHIEGITLILVDAIWLGLAVINYYVMIFRGMPLMIYDVFNVGTAAEVAENYQIEPAFPVVVAVITGAAYLIFACVILLKAWKKMKKKKNMPDWKTVIQTILKKTGIVAGCVGLLLFLCSSDRLGVSSATLNVAQVYEEDGFILGFASSCKTIKKPKGYSTERVQEILTQYDKAQEKKEDKKTLPNIIMIMNESFADLKVDGDYATNTTVLKFVDSLNQNVKKGNCHVSVYGGGTSNSEFEALTGDTLAFLPAGTNAYTQYCSRNMQSLPEYLKTLGYECVAEHPCTASNYNRTNVYNYMGFDKFLSAEEFEDAEIIRYTSDQATYDKIIQTYEEKKAGTPLFMLDVTMQNHGGYSTVTEWKEPIEILGKDCPAVDEYLSSVHVSDQAIESLVNYFAKQKEPTLILFFGDHQPALEGELSQNIRERDGNYMDAKYITPFFIWANYDIDTELGLEASTNYLGMLVLEQAEIENSYTRFLHYLHEQLPVITVNGYMDQFGNWYQWGEESEYTELLNEYQIVQYAELLDSHFEP